MLTDWIIAIVIGIGYIALFFTAGNELMKSLNTDEESWMGILLDRIIISNIENNEIKRLAKCNTNNLQSMIPSADVVEVVRCKNCKSKNINGYCTKFQNNISGIATSLFMPNDDDFCSYGEKKEEE